MSNNNPNINPANNGSLAGTLQFVFGRLMQKTDGTLPAKVIKYDRTTNRVQVHLLINLITEDGSQIPRPQIASLPVLLIGGGEFFLSFPLKEGDLGWVMANDRDISLFLQSYAQSPPNSERVKSFSDGVFIPDVMTNYTIDGEDEENAVLQNLDGSIKITIGANGVTVKAPEVTIEAPSISIDMTSSTNSIQLTGGITASGIVVADNIPPP